MKKIDDQELLGIVYYDAGFIHSRQNRHKEALDYFKKRFVSQHTESQHTPMYRAYTKLCVPALKKI